MKLSVLLLASLALLALLAYVSSPRTLSGNRGEPFMPLTQFDSPVQEQAYQACSKPGVSLTDCYLVQDRSAMNAPITRDSQLLGGPGGYAQVTNNYMSKASNLCDDPVGLGYLQLDEMCFSNFK